MQDFAAIDVQTANHSNTSICAIGVVVVHNGRITNRIYRLVRPMPNYYAGWAVALHGITYDDTIDEHDFVYVWEHILRKFQGLPFVAHNADYVMNCLKDTFNVYAMNYPKYNFFCTIRSARSLYPTMENFDLKSIAAKSGYTLIDHTNALANAEAVAAIALDLPDVEVKQYKKVTKTPPAPKLFKVPKKRGPKPKKKVAAPKAKATPKTAALDTPVKVKAPAKAKAAPKAKTATKAKATTTKAKTPAKAKAAPKTKTTAKATTKAKATPTKEES